MSKPSDLKELMKLYFKPHPWHGVHPGPAAPAEVTAFIEQVPTDTVKYEIDKTSGYLMLDRPQKFSSQAPCLYGFVPRTYCGERVGRYSAEQSGIDGLEGDGDPIDICVLTERAIMHGDFLIKAIPIGGIRMIDSNEADDKIIAVMKDDAVFGQIGDVTGLPEGLMDRLIHYFLSYKDLPSNTKARKVQIDAIYGRSEALRIMELSLDDYKEKFRDPGARYESMIQHLSEL